MPRRSPGARPIGRAGHLTPTEKERLRGWLVEGLSVAEVWARCAEVGIRPPQPEALYRLLNEPETQRLIQSATTEAQEKARKRAVARITARAETRQWLTERLEKLVEARAGEYAGFVPGGETGLMVLSDVKVVHQGKDVPPDLVNIYKFDKAVVDSLLNIQKKQTAEDEDVFRRLNESDRAAREAERHRADMELTKIEADLLARARTLDALDEGGADPTPGQGASEAGSSGPKIIVVDDDSPPPPEAPRGPTGDRSPT